MNTGYTLDPAGGGFPVPVTLQADVWRTADGTAVHVSRVYATEAEAIAGKRRPPKRRRRTRVAVTHAARTDPRD